MNNERLVPDVNNAAHAVARVEGRSGPWIILDRAVVVAVLDVLEKTKKRR